MKILKKEILEPVIKNMIEHDSSCNDGSCSLCLIANDLNEVLNLISIPLINIYKEYLLTRNKQCFNEALLIGFDLAMQYRDALELNKWHSSTSETHQK